MHNWNVYSDFETASLATTDFIAEKIKESIETKGLCTVALPGGNTPGFCLEQLAKKELEWDKVHWYLGDERCYPRGHAERNDEMLKNVFWSHIGSTNIHVTAAELGPEQAVEQYSEEIKDIDSFDIVFLGLGEDGHTASLFPGNVALKDYRSVVPVFNSPKPPDQRISLGVSILQKASNRVVLATGESKSFIIKKIKLGDILPINIIGDLNWFVDEAAVT